MVRALFELVITLIVVMVARSLLTGLFKGISNATAQSFQQSRQPDTANPPQATAQQPRGSELKKDPVCGTYVVESTVYKRQAGGQTFYYCSDACRGKHSLAAR